MATYMSPQCKTQREEVVTILGTVMSAPTDAGLNPGNVG